MPDVPAVNAKKKFGSDRNDAGNSREPRLIGPQQQTQRQPGDQWRPQVDLRQAKPAGADDLRRKRAQDCQRAVKRPGAEIDPDEVDKQQGCERHDLKVASIGPPASHGHSLKDP
jgi:hypothetical protein